MGVVVVLITVVVTGIDHATGERPVAAEEAQLGRAANHEDLWIVLWTSRHEDGGGDSSPFHGPRSLRSAAMRRAAPRRSALRSPRSGAVLRKVLLALVGLALIFETVPRWFSIPGLTRIELNPPYLDSAEDRAFAPHPYLLYAPKPNYGRRADPASPGARSFEHGPLGFRAPEVTLTKPEDTLRIACVGGSSTYGTGPSRDETTWPARLGAALAAGPTGAVEVLNAGVPAWTSFECLTGLAFRVLPMQPDVVLFYLSTNDAESALWPDPVADNVHYRRVWPTFRPSPLESTLERSVLYLVWRRYFTDHLQQRADLGFQSKRLPEGSAGERLARYEAPAVEGPLPDQGFDNFRRNLHSMVAMTRAHGARPVLLTQAIWSDDPDSNRLLDGALRLRAHRRMTDVVRTVAAETGAPLIEVAEHMEAAARAEVDATGSQQIFSANVHLTDAGAGRLADLLALELARLGLL